MSDTLTKMDNWLSTEDKKIIRTQFFPLSATDEDMVYCMGVAKAFNLNPILKQIFFVPRGSYQKDPKGGKDIWTEKIEPLAGRDSFLTLAHRSGRFDGIESYIDIKQVPFLSDEKWDIKDELIATAKVWVKGSDKPFVVEVNYSEYVQYKKDKTTVTAFWKDKPHTMLKKVAESQCLRKAFDITGLYDESEIRNDFIDTEISKKPAIDTKKTSMSDLTR